MFLYLLHTFLIFLLFSDSTFGENFDREQAINSARGRIYTDILGLNNNPTSPTGSISRPAKHIQIVYSNFGINQLEGKNVKSYFEKGDFKTGMPFWKKLDVNQVLSDLPYERQIAIVMRPNRELDATSIPNLREEIANTLIARFDGELEGLDPKLPFDLTFEMQDFQNINSLGYFSSKQQERVEKHGAAVYPAINETIEHLSSQEILVSSIFIVGNNGATELANNWHLVPKGARVVMFDGRASWENTDKLIKRVGPQNVGLFSTLGDLPAANKNTAETMKNIVEVTSRFPNPAQVLSTIIKETTGGEPLESIGHRDTLLKLKKENPDIQVYFLERIIALEENKGVFRERENPQIQSPSLEQRIQVSRVAAEHLAGSVLSLGNAFKDIPALKAYRQLSLKEQNFLGIASKVKTLYNLSGAIERDIQMAKKGNFVWLASHTVEEIAGTTLSLVPGWYEKVSQRIPSTNIQFAKGLTLIAAMQEFVKGGAKQIGKGRMDVEVITHYVDGINSLAWTGLGFAACAGEMTCASAYQALGTTSAKILRDVSQGFFDKMVLASSRQGEVVIEQYLTVQKRRLQEGLPLQRITDVYPVDELKANGISDKQIKELESMFTQVRMHQQVQQNNTSPTLAPIKTVSHINLDSHISGMSKSNDEKAFLIKEVIGFQENGDPILSKEVIVLGKDLQLSRHDLENKFYYPIKGTDGKLYVDPKSTPKRIFDAISGSAQRQTEKRINQTDKDPSNDGVKTDDDLPPIGRSVCEDSTEEGCVDLLDVAELNPCPPPFCDPPDPLPLGGDPPGPPGGSAPAAGGDDPPGCPPFCGGGGGAMAINSSESELKSKSGRDNVILEGSSLKKNVLPTTGKSSGNKEIPSWTRFEFKPFKKGVKPLGQLQREAGNAPLPQDPGPLISK